MKKSEIVKRCGNYKGHIFRPPPPDPIRDELSKRKSDAHKELIDATLETMTLARRDATPRLREAMKREALARFDWQQVCFDYLTYKPVKKGKKSARRTR